MAINNDTHQLIKSVSIEALLGRRDAVVAKVAQAFALIEEARGLSGRTLGEISFEIRGTYGQYHGKIGNDSAVQEFVRDQLDRGGWNYLMNESGLFTFMDAQARKAWHDKMSEQYRGAVRRDGKAADKPIPELTANQVWPAMRGITKSCVWG